MRFGWMFVLEDVLMNLREWNIDSEIITEARVTKPWPADSISLEGHNFDTMKIFKRAQLP